MGEGWELAGADVVCWCVGLVRVGGCGWWFVWWFGRVGGGGVGCWLSGGDELLDVAGCIGRRLDGNVGPGRGEAAWVP